MNTKQLARRKVRQTDRQTDSLLDITSDRQLARHKVRQKDSWPDTQSDRQTKTLTVFVHFFGVTVMMMGESSSEHTLTGGVLAAHATKPSTYRQVHKQITEVNIQIGLRVVHFVCPIVSIEEDDEIQTATR